MGEIKQTKFSGNTYWTDILFHNSEGPGSSPALAIVLPIDSQAPDYSFQNWQITWLTFTPTYEDQMDFYIMSNGLNEITNDGSHYTVYQSDASTVLAGVVAEPQTFPSGDGPDSESRESWYAYLNYPFQIGLTYYVSFVIPFAGTYGFYLEGD